MEMIPVKSSNITHVGHHGTTLHVSYKGGAKYRFEPVTAEQFDKLLAADSKGKFLNSLGIKGKKGKKDMSRRVVIVLDDDVAHRLEVLAAIDNMRLAEEIELLLTHIVRNFEEQRNKP